MAKKHYIGMERTKKKIPSLTQEYAIVPTLSIYVQGNFEEIIKPGDTITTPVVSYIVLSSDYYKKHDVSVFDVRVKHSK